MARRGLAGVRTEGEGKYAVNYLAGLRDRLLNPSLEHRLADIAKDHTKKKQRRIAPVIARAEALNLALPLRRLRAVMSNNVEEHPMTSFNDSG